MIVNSEIEAYMDALLPARDAVLAEMEAFAAEHHIPIIGPAVANLLAQYVVISGAKKIFELGSAIGYSTIWLARAAGEGAEIHYTDGSEENAERARAYLNRAGIAHRVTVHVGDALTSLARTPGEFDLIFNDVDKEGYPAVLEAVPPRLRTGGLFVTDNTLWHERVLKPEDDTTRAVTGFNRNIFRDNNFHSSLIPMRDGLTVAVKRR